MFWLSISFAPALARPSPSAWWCQAWQSGLGLELRREGEQTGRACRALVSSVSVLEQKPISWLWLVARVVPTSGEFLELCRKAEIYKSFDSFGDQPPHGWKRESFFIPKKTRNRTTAVSGGMLGCRAQVRNSLRP